MTIAEILRRAKSQGELRVVGTHHGVLLGPRVHTIVLARYHRNGGPPTSTGEDT